MTPALASGIGFSALVGASCARVAERKKRSVAGWFALGAVFGLVPLLVFSFSPHAGIDARFVVRLLFELIPLGALLALPHLPEEEWQP